MDGRRDGWIGKCINRGREQSEDGERNGGKEGMEGGRGVEGGEGGRGERIRAGLRDLTLRDQRWTNQTRALRITTTNRNSTAQKSCSFGPA
jgi:hypothetical protein